MIPWSRGSMVLAMGKWHIVCIFESNLHLHMFLFRLVQTLPLYKITTGLICYSDILPFFNFKSFADGNPCHLSWLVFFSKKYSSRSSLPTHVNMFCPGNESETRFICVWNTKVNAFERVLSETTEGFRRDYYRNASECVLGLTCVQTHPQWKIRSVWMRFI